MFFFVFVVSRVHLVVVAVVKNCSIMCNYSPILGLSHRNNFFSWKNYLLVIDDDKTELWQFQWSHNCLHRRFVIFLNFESVYDLKRNRLNHGVSQNTNFMKQKESFSSKLNLISTFDKVNWNKILGSLLVVCFNRFLHYYTFDTFIKLRVTSQLLIAIICSRNTILFSQAFLFIDLSLPTLITLARLLLDIIYLLLSPVSAHTGLLL